MNIVPLSIFPKVASSVVVYFKYLYNIIRSSVSKPVSIYNLYRELIDVTALARILLASDGEIVVVTAVQLLETVVGAIV
jgi:hypothetical protein